MALTNYAEMLNKARSSRPRPGARGQGRGQQLKAEVKARCKRKNSQWYMSAVIITVII